MATTSTSTSTSPKRKRYIVSSALLLILFLIISFFFSRRALEFRDLYSQTPLLSSLILSPPRSNIETPFISYSQFNDEDDTKNETQLPGDKKDPVFEKESFVRTASDDTENGTQMVNSGIGVEIKKVPVFENESFVDDTKNGIHMVDSGIGVEIKKDPVSENESSVDDTKNGTQIVDSGIGLEIKKDPVFENEAFIRTTSDGDGDGDGDDTKKGTQMVEDKKDSVFENDSFVSTLVDKGVRNDGGDDRFRGRVKLGKSCNFYVGSWVRDEEYPIYKPGSCPYVDEAYDCQGNGRQDSEYLKWRWKPDGCDLPRFNATDFLARMRGKRLMLVGDSMNRNQFESLLCLLHEGLPNKSKMYETHGYKITKGRGYFVFKFEDYDCTVEFVRSHFLVKEGTRVNGQGNSNPTLSIDRIDKSAGRWKRADILVFNTGHWWTHGKTARGKNYYKEGDYVYPHFDAVEAYRRAIKTWAQWIDKNVNPSKLVFYRGYSSAHFRGGDWDSGGTCNGEKEPIKSGPFLDSYPLKMQIVDEVIREMQVPVVQLNVTRLTNFRKDGHPSVYGKNMTGEKKPPSRRRQDCSHWCLPGVPDAWNELIYANLVFETS